MTINQAPTEPRQRPAPAGCYVCSVPMPPHMSKFAGDDGGDEDGHWFCPRHQEAVYDIDILTGEWSSSEDMDLWRLDCAAEGLRRGRAEWAGVIDVVRRIHERFMRRDDASMSELLVELHTALEAADSPAQPAHDE